MHQKSGEWGYVRVPKAFKERVDLFIAQHPELGFRSAREFFVAAVREKLKEITAQEVEA